MTETLVRPAATRGTTNGNQRGSVHARRARRAWMVLAYQSNIPGYCRCYRCGGLLFNPDDYPHGPSGHLIWKDEVSGEWNTARPLTIDRIIPGCKGGTYRRNNIRPACGGCNSETGGAVRGKK